MLKKRCNDFKKLEKVLEKLLQKENKAYKMQVAMCAYDDKTYQLYKQIAA